VRATRTPTFVAALEAVAVRGPVAPAWGQIWSAVSTAAFSFPAAAISLFSAIPDGGAIVAFVAVAKTPITALSWADVVTPGARIWVDDPLALELEAATPATPR
jgi:hypothetical protein